MSKITYYLKNEIQKLSRSGNKIILSKDGGEITLPEGAAPYDDSELRSKISALESKPDNDKQNLSLNDHELSISNGNSVTLPNDKQTLTISGNTVGISGGNSIELPANKDTIYDDTALKQRVKNLEDKPDKDEQKLSLEVNKLKLTNGGEVDLEKYNTPVVRYTKRYISTEPKEGSESVIPIDSLINKYGVKEGDIVQDIIDDYTGSGKLNFNYWVVSEIRGDNAFISYLGQSTTHGYVDDIRNRIVALENRPEKSGQTLSINNHTISISDGNSIEIPEDNDTKYTAKGRGLFLDSDNAFHIEMGRDVDVIYPFNTNGNPYIKLSPDNRHFIDNEYISYAVDNDGTLNRDAVLEAGLIYDFEGSWNYDGRFVRFSKQTTKLSVCTTGSRANYVTGLISYCFPKNVKFEANFESNWNYNDKVLFNFNPKIVWSIDSDKHTEYYTHYVTKEELDSEEPIEIEVKNGEKVLGTLTITLKNTKVFIRSVQGNVQLKNPADNLFYNMPRLN